MRQNQVLFSETESFSSKLTADGPVVTAAVWTGRDYLASYSLLITSKEMDQNSPNLVKLLSGIFKLTT